LSNELQLQTGPYRTTFIGTEIVRESTVQEWEVYGEILRRVDEAKQWAIGDWLVDGKRHYGDGLYKKAAAILGQEESTLRKYKSLSDNLELFRRRNNLTWAHHAEVASIKKIAEDEKGELALSDETDYEKIAAFLEAAEKDTLSVREIRDRVRIYKQKQTEHIQLANAPEKYSIIYADPPWQYTSGDQHTHETQDTVLEDHYPSMSISELSKLPVHNMVHNEAVLFVWVTSPLLEECFQVIRAWGFQYKTSMVWDKVAHNVGNYVSVRHELLLICTRGSYAPRVRKLHDSVYVEERTEHSAKPEWFRQVIDEIYPTGKRIELFARKHIDGWDVWGNEV